jgi:peroxiredoxin (alkyl hydroperoxide reductase subunit C)
VRFQSHHFLFQYGQIFPAYEPDRMLQPGASNTQAVRAVFIIDPETKVRAILFYPLSNGRNVDEVKRLLVAMQHSDEHKIATPANWRPGDDVIVPPPGSCGVAKERIDKAGGGQLICCGGPMTKVS